MAFSGGNRISLLELAPGRVRASKFDLNQITSELDNEKNGEEATF